VYGVEVADDLILDPEPVPGLVWSCFFGLGDVRLMKGEDVLLLLLFFLTILLPLLSLLLLGVVLVDAPEEELNGWDCPRRGVVSETTRARGGVFIVDIAVDGR
jgi:hypothetical protein